MENIELFNLKLCPVGLEQALKIVISHINRKEGDYFCLANIHLVMEAKKDQHLEKVLNESAANFPDGMGLVAALKFLGNKFKGRVRGADLMLKLCDFSARHGLKIFLYGNTEKNSYLLKEKLTSRYPGLNIIGSICPPFRELSQEEDLEIVGLINKLSPDIIFVSLGAPKQEKWMARHKSRITAVQIGVGAAFDFITGSVKQAPLWMQRNYLEWLYRLPQQPRKTIYRMLLAFPFLYYVFRERLLR